MIYKNKKKYIKHPGSYDRILNVVVKIPYGKVATYGQIAQLAGLEGQSRLAGYALHHIPPGTNIPWHRVINAKGMISLPKVEEGYHLQKKMLMKERIRFKGEKIDLSLYRWNPEIKIRSG
jgi:methylated-DNA-protein-cysteine methyltransferase related protein